MPSTSDERRGENYVLLIGVILRRTDPILSVQERYRHRPGQSDIKCTVNPGSLFKVVGHQSKALASTTTPAACISVTLNLDESIYVFLSEEVDRPLTYVFQICTPRSDDVHHSENVLRFFLMPMRVIMIMIVIVIVAMVMAMVMGVAVVVVLLMIMTMMVLVMAMIVVRLTTPMTGMVMRGRRSCIIKPEFRHRITNHTSQSADSR